MKKITLFLVAVMVFLSACVAPTENPLKIYEGYGLDLQTNQNSTIADKIKFNFSPILPDNINRYSNFYVESSFKIYDSVIANKGAAYLLDFPAFEVEITNLFEHVISFEDVTIKLEDDRGNLYEVMGKINSINGNDVPDVIDSMEAWAAQTKKEIGYNWDLKPFRKALKAAKFIKEEEYLPGHPQTVFMVFDIQDQGLDLLKTSNSFKVHFYGLPVAVDETGKPTKTVNVTYTFNRT